MRTALADPEALVRSLDDLHRGPQAQVPLIAIGEPAVEPLARFLLGPPAQHPQPRMLAAAALGAIGGERSVCGLVAALRAADLRALPLFLRLPEEAVQNVVARELGRLGAREAVDTLLDALDRLHLIEAGRALLAFREPRAIPLLVRCLDDAFIRQRSAEVLSAFGPDAVPALVDGLQRPEIADRRDTAKRGTPRGVRAASRGDRRCPGAARARGHARRGAL